MPLTATPPRAQGGAATDLLFGTGHRARALVSAILAGDAPASEAMGRKELFPLLTRTPLLGSSSKIEMGAKVGVLSTVLYMQPANASGREACAFRSAGCTAACLAEGTGRMSYSGPRTARRRRHAAFYADRAAFLALLCDELARHERKANRAGKVAAVRLNGTTDYPWHRMRVTFEGVSYPSLLAAFPNVRFYEYTKRPLSKQGSVPSNLHLTYSVSEREGSEVHAQEYLRAGYSAAIVMFIPRHFPPSTFTVNGVSYPAVDGDAHDARFLDPPGSIVALAAKGRAKHDTSGFVRHI